MPLDPRPRSDSTAIYQNRPFHGGQHLITSTACHAHARTYRHQSIPTEPATTPLQTTAQKQVSPHLHTAIFPPSPSHSLCTLMQPRDSPSTGPRLSHILLSSAGARQHVRTSNVNKLSRLPWHLSTRSTVKHVLTSEHFQQPGFSLPYPFQTSS